MRSSAVCTSEPLYKTFEGGSWSRHKFRKRKSCWHSEKAKAAVGERRFGMAKLFSLAVAAASAYILAAFGGRVERERRAGLAASATTSEGSISTKVQRVGVFLLLPPGVGANSASPRESRKVSFRGSRVWSLPRGPGPSEKEFAQEIHPISGSLRPTDATKLFSSLFIASAMHRPDPTTPDPTQPTNPSLPKEVHDSALGMGVEAEVTSNSVASFLADEDLNAHREVSSPARLEDPPGLAPIREAVQITHFFEKMVGGAGRIGLSHLVRTNRPSTGSAVYALLLSIARCKWHPDFKFHQVLGQLGGLERVNTLVCLMKLDPDGSGSLTPAEYEKYISATEKLVRRVISYCQTMAIVGTLVIALTHNTSVGRPVAWQVSNETAEIFGAEAGEIILWFAYGFNAITEILALCLLLMCINGRNMLSNLLPSTIDKVEYLGKFNLVGNISFVIQLTIVGLSCVIIFGALVTSPTWGVLGAAATPLVFIFYSSFTGPQRLFAMQALHDEAQEVIARYLSHSKTRDPSPP